MGTELAKQHASFDLAVATTDSTPAELVEALQETLGGRLRPYDLQKIVWPSGKATTWEIPTVGGETEPAKEITAIPILTQTVRLFWERREKAKGEEASPPDCKSDDGVTAEPTARAHQLGATGRCEDCPLAQWGKNSEPPACKERRELFLLLEGQYFPMVLSVPPSSIRVWRDFVKPLSLQGVAPWMAVVRFRLQTETGASGDPYALLKLEYVGKLLPEAKERMKDYRETLLTTFRAGLEATRAEAKARQDQPQPDPQPAAAGKAKAARGAAPKAPEKPEFSATGEEMPIED